MDNNLLNDRIGQLKKWEQTQSLNEILFSVLSNLNAYTQKRFDTLTEEIKSETVLLDKTPIIKTAVCLAEDIEKQIFLYRVSGTPPINSPGYVTTVFADCDYPVIRELMRSTYAAEIHTKTGTIKTQVSLRYSKKYLQKLQSLYYAFSVNELPWVTVNSVYFYKFLDVYSNDIERDIEINGFDINFGQYAKHLSYDKELLWNVNTMTATTASCEAVPAYNTVLYEHTINNLQLDENKYLVCPVDDRFISFRRGQTLFVRTYSKQFEQFNMLRIASNADADNPLFLQPKSNQKKPGFIEASARGRYIPTRGEAERIVHALSDGADLRLIDIKVLPYSKEKAERCKGIDYNFFMESNKLWPERKLLLFTFKAGSGLKWAHEAMFYVLSELQLYFYEYRCIGEMV